MVCAGGASVPNRAYNVFVYAWTWMNTCYVFSEAKSILSSSCGGDFLFLLVGSSLFNYPTTHTNIILLPTKLIAATSYYSSRHCHKPIYKTPLYNPPIRCLQDNTLLASMVEEEQQRQLTQEPRGPHSDRLSEVEQEFFREQTEASYDEGSELGKRVGAQDGYKHGYDMATKRASEIGFYRGYSLTWLHILQSNPNLNNNYKTASVLSKLNEVLELTNDYPKTNETCCEEKLLDIRLKFKQSTSMLNTNTH